MALLSHIPSCVYRKLKPGRNDGGPADQPTSPLAIRVGRMQTVRRKNADRAEMMTVPHSGAAAHTQGLPIVAYLGALGVVYGYIGTSPLYALKEAAKAAAHGGQVMPDAILGVVSLILWALILIISIKYALLILRADNRGEGGIVALLALL